MTETPTIDQLRDAIQRVIKEAQDAYDKLRPTFNALADAGALPPALAADLRRQEGPVAGPGAAPAVDESLLIDLRRQIKLAVATGHQLDDVTFGRCLLQLNAMRRLRTVWEHNARLDRDFAASRLQAKDEQLAQVERERNEALEGCDNAVVDLERAEAELDRLRAAQQTGDLEEALWRVLRQSAPRPFPDSLVDAVQQLCAQARAVPQLPDVRPVYAPSSRYLACEGQWFLNRHAAAQFAAAALAVVREFDRRDAEAADTSSDDEVDAARDELGEAYCTAVGITDEHLRTVIRAVDAHRARGEQEAGQ